MVYPKKLFTVTFLASMQVQLHMCIVIVYQYVLCYVTVRCNEKYRKNYIPI